MRGSLPRHCDILQGGRNAAKGSAMVTSVGTSASMHALKAAIAEVTIQRAMNADAITVSTLLASIVIPQAIGASGVGGNVDIKA